MGHVTGAHILFTGGLALLVLGAAAVVVDRWRSAQRSRARHLVARDAADPVAPRTHVVGPFELVVLAISTLYVMWTVLSSPVKGLANQGDYQRLTTQLGVAPVPSQPYSPYSLTYDYRVHQTLTQLGFAPRFVTDPSLYHYYFGYHSSELLLAKVAIGLSSLLGQGSSFDLRWLGGLNALVWLLALTSLVVATRQLSHRARPVAVVLLALAFTDFGYLQYANSFFSEPAEIGFLLLALGLAACIPLVRRPVIPFSGFVVASAMAVSAKTEDAVVTIPLVALGAYIAWRRLNPKSVKIAGSASLVLIVAAGLWSWVPKVPYYTRYQLYQAVFDGILRTTPHPAQTLKSLGLSPTLARYAGYAAGSPKSGFADSSTQTLFFPHITVGKIVGFYLTHPGNLVSALSSAAPHMLYLRPPYANLPASPSSNWRGYLTDSPWTLVHRDLLPHSLWFVVAVIIAGAAIGVWSLTRGRRQSSPEVLVATAVIAGLLFVESPVGGGLEGLIKHSVAFNALLDTVLIVLIALVVDTAWSTARPERRRQSRSGSVGAGSGGEAEARSTHDDAAAADDVDDHVGHIGIRGS